MLAPFTAGDFMHLMVAFSIKGPVMQVKLARGRGEVHEAAALFAAARDRVDGVEPGPLGGLQRRLMEEVSSHAAAYAVIASLESLSLIHI